MKSVMTAILQDEPGADIAQALEDGWLPIREVARQTGVNAVTLRAWERRYGLIVPQRTPKGHRLFNAEHVQRIHTILTWLNRGVPVSQVKGLIDSAQALPDAVKNEWQALRQNLVQAVSELAQTSPKPSKTVGCRSAKWRARPASTP
jgi:DNA-binding transcriptional MerR regulator